MQATIARIFPNIGITITIRFTFGVHYPFNCIFLAELQYERFTNLSRKKSLNTGSFWKILTSSNTREYTQCTCNIFEHSLVNLTVLLQVIETYMIRNKYFIAFCLARKYTFSINRMYKLIYKQKQRFPGLTSSHRCTHVYFNNLQRKEIYCT